MTIFINVQSSTQVQFIPSFQNEAASTVYAVLLLPLSFQDAEDFAGEVWAVYVLWIRNVAKIVIGLIVSIPNYRCLTPNSNYEKTHKRFKDYVSR